MATPTETPGDRFRDRKAFLEAIVSARRPIRAKNLTVPGLDRRAIQKRLERLRRLAGDPSIGDEVLVEFARTELAHLAGPRARGLLKIRGLADPLARRFAEAAAIQRIVIGDWVETASSPRDLGWSRSQIAVRETPRRTVFLRGRSQSWLAEKKRFLKERWPAAKADVSLKRNFVPNQLKADLMGFVALGSEDSPGCVIQVATVDWLTCVSLNSRLDSSCLAGDPGDSRTLRERWGDPSRVVERRALPGMLVAHIIVETRARRFLVCLRETAGMQDESGTWSLSIEERWSASGSPHGPAGSGPDAHPHDVVKRAVHQELGLTIEEAEVRVLSWGIEATVLYPGFIAIARTSAGSWEVAGLRAQASDANEIRFVSSVPADLESLQLLDEAHFTPTERPNMRRRWHRTSKARLYTALAHTEARDGSGGRDALLTRLGGPDRSAR